MLDIQFHIFALRLQAAMVVSCKMVRILINNSLDTNCLTCIILLPGKFSLPEKKNIIEQISITEPELELSKSL